MTHRKGSQVRTHQEAILDELDLGEEDDTKIDRVFTNTKDNPNTKGNPSLPTYLGGLAFYGIHRRASVNNVEGNVLKNDRVERR